MAVPVEPPWLSSLPRSSRIAYPIVQRGVAEGFSSRRLADALAKGGIGIRRQSLLDMMRLERGIQATGGLFQKIGRDFAPAPERLPFALHGISNAFSYVVKVEGSLLATGQRFEGYVTVSSDRSLSRQDIESAAEDATTRKGTEYEMEVDQVTIVRGVRNPGVSAAL